MSETASSADCTAAHLARLFNVSERRIQQLAKDNVIQRTGYGTYDLIGSVQSYIKYLQSEYRKGSEDLYKKEIQRQNAALLTLKTEEKAFHLARLKEEWVCAAEVEEEWGRQILNARAKLLALPHKATPILRNCDPSEVEAVLRDLIYETLNELSEMEMQPLSTYSGETLTHATDAAAVESTSTAQSE